MIAFLLEHWALSSAALGVILAAVGAGLLLPGGFAILLNPRVMGAILIALAVIAAAMWREHDKETLRAEGAAAIERANEQAAQERRDLNASWEKELAEHDNASTQRLAAAMKRIDDLEKRPRNVTPKADAACGSISRGFVRDHDIDLSAAAGRAQVPAAAANDDPDRPVAGLVLSRVGSCVGANYAECARVRERLDACESRRYEACIAYDKKYGTRSGCTR